MNSVKLEHPAYYCNNYSEQGSVVADRTTSVDAMVVSAAYCKYLRTHFQKTLPQKNLQDASKECRIFFQSHRFCSHASVAMLATLN
jgi:hypothetical protein